MKTTYISASLTILENATPAELAGRERIFRAMYHEACLDSQETHPPSISEMMRWWKRAAQDKTFDLRVEDNGTTYQPLPERM